MADVQKEHGFTSIANEIMEKIPQYKFNGTQFRILMVVWRYTYGFHRLSHAFSLTFLHQATGMSRDSIKREVRRLIDMNVLLIVSDASFNRSRELQFNKDYDQWNVENNRITEGHDRTTGGDSSPSATGGKSVPSQGANPPPPQGANPPPKKESIKYNFKEINNDDDNTRARENPFNFFEQNGFGTISPTISEAIGHWLDDGSFDEPENIVTMALKVAVLNNVRHWKYVNQILVDWSNKGLRTSADVMAEQKRWEAQKKGANDRDKHKQYAGRDPTAGGENETASEGYYSGIGRTVSQWD